MNGRRFAFTVWGLAAALAAAVQLAGAAGLRINHTASLPMGLWLIEVRGGAIGRGDIVSICPPDTDVFRVAQTRGYVPYGRCPGGYEPLLKPVAAIAGDIVLVTPAGLAVNGRAVPNSVALAAGTEGLTLPRHPAGSFIVAACFFRRRQQQRRLGPVLGEQRGFASEQAVGGEMDHTGACQPAALRKRLDLRHGRPFAEIDGIGEVRRGNAEARSDGAKLIGRLRQRLLAAKVFEVYLAAAEQRGEACQQARRMHGFARRGLAAILFRPGALAGAVRPGQQRIAEAEEWRGGAARSGGVEGLGRAMRRSGTP